MSRQIRSARKSGGFGASRTSAPKVVGKSLQAAPLSEPDTRLVTTCRAPRKFQFGSLPGSLHDTLGLGMSDHVFVVAHFTAKPGRATDLRAVIEAFVAPTRLEKGCIQYDLCVDADHPDKFTFVEQWESRADLEAHGRSTHITSGRLKLPDLIAEPAWVQVVRKIV